jgi:hypothetical protein
MPYDAPRPTQRYANAPQKNGLPQGWLTAVQDCAWKHSIRQGFTPLRFVVEYFCTEYNLRTLIVKGRKEELFMTARGLN